MSNYLKCVINTKWAILIAVWILASCKTEQHATLSKQMQEPWNKLKKIDQAIKEPFFRDANYNVIAFGAVADGKTYCTESFKKAIAEGATVLMELSDQNYGRTCGVTDPFGNIWWITSVDKLTI